MTDDAHSFYLARPTKNLIIWVYCLIQKSDNLSTTNPVEEMLDVAIDYNVSVVCGAAGGGYHLTIVLHAAGDQGAVGKQGEHQRDVDHGLQVWPDVDAAAQLHPAVARPLLTGKVHLRLPGQQRPIENVGHPRRTTVRLCNNTF